MILISSTYANPTHIKLATTTSTENSGLLDKLFPPFEAKFNVKVDIITVGTGKALKLGENGDVDVVLVHAREAEDKFIEEGYGVNRRDFMYNDFMVMIPGLIKKKRLYGKKQELVLRVNGIWKLVKEWERPYRLPMKSRLISSVIEAHFWLT